MGCPAPGTLLSHVNLLLCFPAARTSTSTSTAAAGSHPHIPHHRHEERMLLVSDVKNTQNRAESSVQLELSPALAAVLGSLRLHVAVDRRRVGRYPAVRREVLVVGRAGVLLELSGKSLMESIMGDTIITHRSSGSSSAPSQALHSNIGGHPSLPPSPSVIL